MNPLEKMEYAIVLLDGLAKQWGDEAVFRRARDLLKEVLPCVKAKGCDWLIHDGRGCPVERKDDVIVQSSNGVIAYGPSWMFSDNWQNKSHPFDIIAYQVIEPYKPD